MTRSPLLISVFVLLCGLAVTGGLAVRHSDQLAARGLHEHGVPFVGNNDGYYHLFQARALAKAGASPLDVFTDSRRSMLLPYLLSTVAEDRDALHLVAAYAGPVLGLSMLLAVLPWAVESRSRFVMAAAPLLALIAPYWIGRTHTGFLDTDGLVPGACLFALFCLFRAVAGKRRLAWAAGYLLTGVFLWYWWRPGAFLCAGFLACRLAYPHQTRTGRLFKWALVAVGAALVGLALAGVEPLAGAAGYAIKHFRLAFGHGGASMAAAAITELRGAGAAGLGEQALGTVWLLPLALLGTAVYAVRRRRDAVFLVSGWVFAVAGVFSQRFIPLFVPVGAFFAAYGLAACAQWIGGLARNRAAPVRAIVLAACLPLLFWGAAVRCAAYEPESYFTRHDHALAETVRESFPEGTVIWTWWDFGYFFRYLTGMDTYFDGGSQTERTCFVAAYPLMQEDTAAAAAWMHHFAGSGPKGFTVAGRGAGWPSYLRGFTRRIVEEGSAGGAVGLVLPARTYSTTTGYLYAFAHAFDETAPAVSNHLDLFPGTGFRFGPGDGTVTVPRAVLDKGYASFGGVIDATDAVPEEVDFSVIPDPYLVFSRKADFLAVTDRLLVRSVLFRLLGLFRYDTRRFEPVTFGYRSGGVWRVRR